MLNWLGLKLDYPQCEEKKFYLRPGTVDMIQASMRLKSRRELARHLHVSHAWLCSLDHQRKCVTDDFMIILVHFFTIEKFHVVLEVKSTGNPLSPVNHPSQNLKKMRGEIPYSRFSIAAQTRKLDGEVEVLEK